MVGFIGFGLGFKFMYYVYVTFDPMINLILISC